MGGTMSSIQINGDTSGSVILQAPAVSGSTTLTLPTTSGTVLTNVSTITPSAGTVTQASLSTNVAGNGPAFSAYQSSAQSIAHNTFTKVQFQTENFDTNSNFDNSTNYRFTPTVAGYYYVSELVCFNSLSQNSFSQILKNGSSVANSPTGIPWAGISNSQTSASVLVYMNGSTDYLEVWAYQASGGALNLITGTNITAFSAFLARSA